MCVEIYFEDGTVAGTPRELRRFMPVIVLDPDYGSMPRPPDLPPPAPATGPPIDPEDCCLCPIDVEATAAANGYRVERWPTGFEYDAIKLPD